MHKSRFFECWKAGVPAMHRSITWTASGGDEPIGRLLQHYWHIAARKIRLVPLLGHSVPVPTRVGDYQ